MSETRPVRVERQDGPTPGLEILAARRVDGPDDGPQQARTLVATDGDEQRLVLIDTAQERVSAAADQQADLIESVLSERVRERVEVKR
jgi:hypothetical protein